MTGKKIFLLILAAVIGIAIGSVYAKLTFPKRNIAEAPVESAETEDTSEMPVTEELFCGGAEGVSCPEGYYCQFYPDNSESGGICKKIESPQMGDAATSEECDEKGGVWQAWGLAEIQYCQIPAEDAKKDCTDGSECIYGKCIAGEKNAIPGKCQKFKNTFGCLSYLTDGKIGETLCID